MIACRYDADLSTRDAHTTAPAAIAANSTDGGRSRRVGIGRSVMIQKCRSQQGNNHLGRTRDKSNDAGKECARNNAV